MPETCENCRFPLSQEERLKYRDRCRWCGAPEWRPDSERTALWSLAEAKATCPSGGPPLNALSPVTWWIARRQLVHTGSHCIDPMKPGGALVPVLRFTPPLSF